MNFVRMYHHLRPPSRRPRHPVTGQRLGTAEERAAADAQRAQAPKPRAAGPAPREASNPGECPSRQHDVPPVGRGTYGELHPC